MKAGQGSDGIPRSGFWNGFATSMATVAGSLSFKDYVLAQRLRRREVFVPLRHDPGHAQVDFGETLAEIAGVEGKIHFFAMDLPHSDACFVQAYPAEVRRSVL
jgi:hypothetical protein